VHARAVALEALGKPGKRGRYSSSIAFWPAVLLRLAAGGKVTI
jgi:hypothetical protein